jgi:hypothetical protein
MAAKKKTVAKMAAEYLQEGFSMTALNRLMNSAADYLSDLSLVQRETAQSIQLERQQMIEREDFIRKTTETMIDKHSGDLIQAAKEGVAKNDARESDRPANFAEIFATAGNKDPNSK